MASLNILLAILIWSSYGVIVRLSAVPVHVLIFFSCVVSIAVQGSVILLKGYRRDIPGIRALRYPLVIGVILLANTFTFFYAFTHTTIANAVLTHYTAPIIVAVLATVFLKEKLSGRIVFAIVIASTGLWIMLDGFSLNSGHTAGILAGLASGLAYALLIIIARVSSPNFNPVVLSFLSNIVIVLLLVPFIERVPVEKCGVFLLLGTFHSTLAPVLYYKGLKFVTANRAAVLGYLEPVCAILFSMIFLKEIPGSLSFAGGLLIIFSGYLTLKGRAFGNEENP